MPPKTKETMIIPNDEGISLDQLKALTTVNQNDDFDDTEKTDEDYLQEVFAELGGSGSAKVNVYQVETGKPLAFVGSFAPDMFSIEAIQQSYGAGEYAVHVRVDGRIKSKRTIRIAKPRETPQPNGGGISAHDVANIVRETVRDLIPRETAPVKSTKDMLDEMLIMKQILAADQPKTSGVDDFLKMLDVAKTIVNPAPEPSEPSTSQLLMNGISAIAPVLAAGMQQQNRQPMQPRQPMPPPAPAPAQTEAMALPIEGETITTANLSPINESDEAMNFQQKIMLDMLIKNAANDNDPVTYANVILDLVGAEKAIELLQRDDWFTWLAEQDARVQSYQQWFIELRAIVLDLASQELNISLTNSENNVINTGNLTENVPDNAISAEQS